MVVSGGMVMAGSPGSSCGASCHMEVGAPAVTV